MSECLLTDPPGRSYHAYYGPDKNLMPTDEIEQDRLDIHHEIMLLVASNTLHQAPVSPANRVLDLGTGTGIWAIEYADAHPEAEVIGIDLSPIQPSWVPPNCRFEVDDFELDWTYQKNSFDFIHGRNVVPSIKDLPGTLKQVKDHLKPGGYIELAELGWEMFSDDNTLKDSWAPKRCFDLGREAMQKLGRPVPTKEWLEQTLRDAGFVDVVVKTWKHPMGGWPKNKDLKQAGKLFVVSTETGYHAYHMTLLTRVHGWTSEKADELCKQAHAAHCDTKSGVHAYSLL